ncbi:hypothetical protein [Salipaludibacillus aurantiacus]|uniref:Uncharacterized protein n=1 Tax=Salipaludibacillus aurantiacus TaxID=1601833 RepID=A0A1H9ULX0_9BACI|nr:hypothetical protein [Salipaludibacillus aurantiacus]SES10301.1 hypothetical protein SAMN05518684_10829 [Salipaludibacillus aurantiacus]
MNKSLEGMGAPGSQTYQLIIPRSDVEREQVNHQIELTFDKDEK